MSHYQTSVLMITDGMRQLMSEVLCKQGELRRTQVGLGFPVKEESQFAEAAKISSYLDKLIRRLMLPRIEELGSIPWGNSMAKMVEWNPLQWVDECDNYDILSPPARHALEHLRCLKILQFLFAFHSKRSTEKIGYSTDLNLFMQDVEEEQKELNLTDYQTATVEDLKCSTN